MPFLRRKDRMTATAAAFSGLPRDLVNRERFCRKGPEVSLPTLYGGSRYLRSQTAQALGETLHRFGSYNGDI
jgi:hypothetical protein